MSYTQSNMGNTTPGNQTVNTLTTEQYVADGWGQVGRQVDEHDHSSGKGLAVKRVQTSSTPATAGDVEVTGEDLKWYGTGVRTAVNTDQAQTITATKTLNSNLVFGSTGQRITGDMSNATHANRLMFQTSTASASTILGILSNGSGTGQMNLYSGTDPDNSPMFQLASTSVSALISSSKTGSGTVQNMLLQVNGTTIVTLTNGGGAQIGAPTGGDKGAGTLNATGLYVNGTAVATTLTSLTASLGADVLLNNTANYFDGPSVAQGTSGTWFVSGQIVCGSSGGDNYYVKLWDGTTVIASLASVHAIAGGADTLSLAGVITSPAGNLRLSARDITSTSGKIFFNQTGNSKDSTITAVRIG